MTLIDKHSNGRISVISIGQPCQNPHMHIDNCLLKLDIVNQKENISKLSCSIFTLG